ncbi:MAG: twin-arginine translocation signal domain-containing protein, partial [Atopobiaceae bacterium]|nr:twin-arginine translocation signal domain-containing protein [Atopobiaceae bacterium]
MGKHMFSRRNFLKLAAATGSASMLAACGGGSSDGGSDAASAAGDGIGVMLSTNVMSLDTDLATDGDSFEVIADCIDGLMQMDADGAAI